MNQDMFHSPQGKNFKVTQKICCNKQSSLVNKQPSLVNKQSSLVNKQPSFVNKQSSLVNKQSSLGRRWDIQQIREMTINCLNFDEVPTTETIITLLQELCACTKRRCGFHELRMEFMPHMLLQRTTGVWRLVCHSTIRTRTDSVSDQSAGASI